MDNQTAQRLCDINTAFYQQQRAPFAATRQAPQPGWQRCLEELSWDKAPAGSVFDLACGNLRFEYFLQQHFPTTNLEFHALDSCDDLVFSAQDLHEYTIDYQSLDVLQALFAGQDLSSLIVAPPCDLAVCFGFMHHVPTTAFREQILRALISQTQPEGLVIISFWQFMSDEKFASKAQVAHRKACLELGLPKLDENDFLLGWQDHPGAWRYCHSFSDDEIDDLLEAVSDQAKLVSRFKADGRTGSLASYLILSVL